MIRKICNYLYNRFVCNHEFVSDIQITFIKCKKCGVKYYYKYGDIYE